MADYDLGTVRGKIEIDTDADKAVKKTQQSIGGLKGSLDTFGKSAGGLATAGGLVATAGGAIAGAFGLAVKSATSYEKQMSAVKAVSGATETEMKALNDTALRIGKDTAFSASEAALAIEELVKAGIAVPDVMNGAADATVALAAAGGVDLPEAATIAANAMNQFGLTAKELPNVVDQIAGAANASAIDVGEFGNSLSQVGAVANLTGFDFDDLAVAIAQMGNAGIKGSDAGTSLKTMFQNLIPSTNAQISLFEELGLMVVGDEKAMASLRENGINPLSNSYGDVKDAISKYVAENDGFKVGTLKNRQATMKLGQSLGALRNGFFDAEGNVESMANVQETLAKATANLTKEQRLEAFGIMFGSDAIRAAAVMADNGRKGFEEMATSMGKVTAESVAQERLNNLAGMWEALKGSLETVAITIGQTLLPYLKQLMGFLIRLVNGWNNLSAGSQKTIIIVSLIAAALMLVIGAILAVAAGIAGLVAVFAAAGTIALPIIAVVAAIAAAVAIVIALAIVIYKNWDKIKSFTFSVFGAIRDFFVTVWTAIVDFVKSVFSGIVGWFAGVFGAIRDAFVSGLGFIKDTWNNFWAGLRSIVTSVWGKISAVVSGYISLVRGVISSGLAFIGRLWTAFWQGPFGGLLKAVWGLIVALVMFGVNTVRNVIVSVFTAIASFVITTWTEIVDFLKRIWDGIVGFLSPIIDRILAVVMAGFNWLKTQIRNVLRGYQILFTTAWNFISTKTAAAWNAIKNRVSGPLTTLKNFLSTILGTIRTQFANAWNAVSEKTKAIWNSVGNYVRDKINAMVDRVRGIRDRVLGAVRGFGSILYNAGRGIIQGLIDGIMSMVGWLTDKLNWITSLIPDAKGPARKDRRLLEDNGELVMEGFINGIVRQVGRLRGELGDITNAVPSMINLNPDIRTPEFAAGTQSAPSITKIINQDVKNFNPSIKPDSLQINDDLQMASALLEV